jgi:hypothetical protein
MGSFGIDTLVMLGISVPPAGPLICTIVTGLAGVMKIP